MPKQRRRNTSRTPPPDDDSAAGEPSAEDRLMRAQRPICLLLGAAVLALGAAAAMVATAKHAALLW